MISRLWPFFLSFVLIGCSANKFLPKGEKYFEGHVIEYVDEDKIFPRDIKYSLDGELIPSGTRRYLFSRPGTWLYQAIEEPKKDKGLKHWLKYKMGSKPDLLSSVSITDSRNYISASLKRNGYFDSEVSSYIDSTRHKAKVVYEVTLNEPHVIDTLLICSDPDTVCQEVAKASAKISLLEPGDLFRQINLEEKRKAISDSFKNKGFFYFTPRFLFYDADSLEGTNKVKLRLNLREEIPESGLTPYYINSVLIDLAGDTMSTEISDDTLNIVYNEDKLYLDPIKLRQYWELEVDSLYRKEKERISLAQLSKLDVFDYLNIEYTPRIENGEFLLDARLTATPRKRHSLRAEFNLSTTSINYTGPGLQLEYYDRNLFRGAEKLKIGATGRYEVQLSGTNEGLAAFEVDLQANLLIPSVRGPIRKKSKPGNVPNTRYRLQYKLYNQPDYYAQSTFGFGYGYEWLTSNRIFHDLRLINFDYLRLLESSEQLEELLNDGVLSRESFEDQVIAGPAYSISINSKPSKSSKFSHYLGFSVEAAGNLLYLGYNAAGAERNENGQFTLGGVPFSQYVRLFTDIRGYIKVNKYNTIALRQIIGIGAPYSNSSALPFAKQFFVGGASSLRGFQVRSVGPGTYFNEVQGSFFDQTGDIQIEWNAENRFNMGKYLEGAIFIDMGNVWLAKKNEKRPGGEFIWNQFLRQMAISSGIGMRINLEFVIVRFDFGVPLRIPSRPSGQKWIWNDVDDEFNDGRRNLILNFAIGYPF